MTDAYSDKKEMVNQLYEHVLHVVNRMLHNAQNFNISVLKLQDPSYRQITEQLLKVCTIMDLIADDLTSNGNAEEAWTASKARDYVQHVIWMAKAIENGDEAALRQLCDELDGRSFL